MVHVEVRTANPFPHKISFVMHIFYVSVVCDIIDNLGEVHDEVSSCLLALHSFNPNDGVFAFLRMNTCQPTVLHGVIVQETSSKQHLAQKPEDV